jgi:hypothetical protein
MMMTRCSPLLRKKGKRAIGRAVGQSCVGSGLSGGERELIQTTTLPGSQTHFAVLRPPGRNSGTATPALVSTHTSTLSRHALQPNRFPASSTPINPHKFLRISI